MPILGCELHRLRTIAKRSAIDKWKVIGALSIHSCIHREASLSNTLLLELSWEKKKKELL
jgi:hypothetical protein